MDELLVTAVEAGMSDDKYEDLVSIEVIKAFYAKAGVPEPMFVVKTAWSVAKLARQTRERARKPIIELDSLDMAALDKIRIQQEENYDLPEQADPAA